jgi:DNA polymerase III sliding clamp (beta) subunit (PCNA family)
MKLKINPDNFVPYFEFLGRYVDEAVITFNKDGLEVVVPDRAMVCVCKIFIPSKDFEVFEIDKPFDLGLDIQNFVNVLKRGSKENRIAMETTKKNQLEIGFNSRKFTIPLLNISKEEIPPVQDLEFTSKFRIKSAILKTMIEDSLAFGDGLFVEADGSGKLKFNSDGELTKFEGEVDLEQIISKAKAKYPLDYLSKMKFIDEYVDFNFGKDYPCKIVFGNCFIVVAPRVVEEEEEEDETKAEAVATKS